MIAAEHLQRLWDVGGFLLLPLCFSLQLCELELIQREKRAAERRLKAAASPNPETLEDFKFEAQPSLNRVPELKPFIQ